MNFNKAIIRAEALSKRINESYIIRNINLEIQSGEFVGIMGPSGSGKTTLLNILGLMDSYSGKLLLFNRTVETLNVKEKAVLRNKSIGFMFQSHMLLPELSLIDNIILPQYIFESDKKKAYGILEYLCLNEKANRLPAELSTGELQRGAFARAIINHPKLILADEPTGNLDQNNKCIILNLLKEYSKKYMTTVIIATHDEIIKNYCDNVHNIQDGSLV